MLTTSHRNRYTIAEWKELFRQRGISIEKLAILPNYGKGIRRKDELMNWFNVNGINEDFLILDDDKSLNDLPQYLKQNLIQPVAHIGLTRDHLEEIAIKSIKQLERA